MEKGKEKEEKEGQAPSRPKKGQVGRRHEAQRKHIHVDDARRSGWMDISISKASQRQSECQKRFFRQRRKTKRHAGAEKG